MERNWERIKVPLAITQNDWKISLIGRTFDPEDQRCLERLDPNNDAPFPDSVKKRIEAENCLSYSNTILIEASDEEPRYIDSHIKSMVAPDEEPEYLPVRKEFRSYPTAVAVLIDRIEDHIAWQDESNYPIQLERFRISSDRRDVPINIVNEGKSVVAAYLFIIHGWSKAEVAEMLDVSSQTVQQYLTNVMTGNR